MISSQESILLAASWALTFEFSNPRDGSSKWFSLKELTLSSLQVLVIQRNAQFSFGFHPERHQKQTLRVNCVSRLRIPLIFLLTLSPRWELSRNFARFSMQTRPTSSNYVLWNLNVQRFKCSEESLQTNAQFACIRMAVHVWQVLSSAA